jgi:hypothetical protein
VIPRPTVNGLPLPEALVALIRRGSWVHPGPDKLREIIPFLVDPVVFVSSPEAMAFHTMSMGRLVDYARCSETFHMLRGDRLAEPVELPWLDVNRFVVIAVCERPGDDVVIALDYRTSLADPRVVANEWDSVSGCFWREVAPNFSGFAKRIGLAGQDG